MDFIKHVASKLERLYYLYMINTAVYLLKPVERAILNTVFFSIFFIIIYSTLVYLPAYVYTIVMFFSSLVSTQQDNSWLSELRESEPKMTWNNHVLEERVHLMRPVRLNLLRTGPTFAWSGNKNNSFPNFIAIAC